MSKNNIFFFSPGGYGPYSRIHFWGDHIEATDNEVNNDDWMDAAYDHMDEHSQDVDYGCYFMSRKDVEQIIQDLKKLLEE